MHVRKLSGFLVLFLFAACAPEVEIQNPQMDIPDTHKIGGLAVGTQAYTFNRYSVMEAIEKTDRAGGRVIEFYPGQLLAPDEDEIFDQHVSDEVIDRVLAKLDEHDIIPVNFGVVSLPNNEEEQRQVFEFAQKLGVQSVTSEPSLEAMDLIEQMVREYDIKVAIHNHPRGWGPEGYMLWDPEYVLSMVEDRDPRIGACADVGHWIRSDIVPVDGLRILEGRLVSLHFSDVGAFGPDGEDVIAGHGVADVPAILEELKRQNFGGHISIEYETNWFENVYDVAQIVGYIQGWADTSGY